MDRIIVNFTPTGIIPTKKDTMHVPVSPAEIIEEVKHACEIGITMVHLHARDDDEVPTHRKAVYAEIIEGIRATAPELVICVSTSGRTFNQFEARSEVLELDGFLKPDMASLTLSSLNFNKVASANSPEMIQALARRMLEKGIRPELEIFDLGMANYLNYLIKKKLLKAPYYINLILGNIACAQTDLLHIGCMMRDIPQNALVSLGAVGTGQLKMNSLAIALGRGVRIGLEDNFWYDENRTQLATNSDLLIRINDIIRANEQRTMKPGELRELLKLETKAGCYGISSTA
ncbi:3-keto-5-aminohexanoate cleavage protein [bacterium]|nr:3-keto-5-aminohexanoate cleavage protein [bacterium]